MFLEDVKEEPVELGTLVDNITKDQYQLFLKKCGPFNEHVEYRININHGEELAGYLKFVPQLHGQDDYVLSALKTEHGFRGRKLSNALIEILFQYAELNNKPFNTVVQQRKPLTAFIIQKYGFEPVDNRPRDRVEILGRYDDNLLMVAFRDVTKRREFEASRLCINSEQYKVVAPQPGLLIDTVTLLTPYILIDAEKCDRRRKEIVQRRFSINFND
ncbi:MAG: hypothetical protein ABIG93_03270 [archaeon]|nr:hypothetical protein [Nanoarchaeota archaeon]